MQLDGGTFLGWQSIKAADAIAASKSASANLAKQLGETPTTEIKPKGGNYNPDGRKGKQKDEPKNLNDYNHLDKRPGKGTDLGTSPEYLAARIARDRPDIQSRMKAGEYPSVRAFWCLQSIEQVGKRYRLW